MDARGKRRLKSFKLKKDANAFEASAKVEVRQGVHIADRDTVTIEEAGRLWLDSCDAAGLERSTCDQYEKHLRLHITPFLGSIRLSLIIVPAVRAFQYELRGKGRSAVMVKRVTVSLGSIPSDAQERGLIVRNAVQEMSKRRKGASTTEKRQKARLRYGADNSDHRRNPGHPRGRTGPLRAVVDHGDLHRHDGVGASRPVLR